MTTQPQIDPVSGLAINCSECIHCQVAWHGSDFNKCKKCSTYCNIVHSFPNVYGHLCNNYSAWAPRKKGIIELIVDKIRKLLE
jgi:hypothetical protein